MAAATTFDLPHGRTLALAPDGDEDLVEIRSASGAVEIRLRVTEEGPILEVEGVRLSLRAARSVDVECEEFNVSADGDITLAGGGDVRVTGETIHLN